MPHRIIFDHDPHPLRLFDELYFQGVQDFKGLPLGDIAGHAQRRYTACFGALGLARMLTDLRRIDAAIPVEVVGARFQDKRSSREFPAAHHIPCDLALGLPGHAPPGVLLHDLFQEPFSKTWARREIFGRTHRVHRLVNVADRSCEAGPDGMAIVFARACEEVIREGLRANEVLPARARSLGAGSPRTLPYSDPATAVRSRGAAQTALAVQSHFDTILLPGFVIAARQRLQLLEEDLTDYEHREMTRGHPVDRFGKPLVPRPADTRLHSPDAEARAAAKITLRQILQTYADPTIVDRQALNRIAAQIDALRFNESKWSR